MTSALTSRITFSACLYSISGAGASIKSSLCKTRPDRLRLLCSSLSARITAPFNRLFGCSVSLLTWLGDSGDSAYMLGQTAPSSFDSRVFLVAPYSGLPSDWLRFERDFFSRLEREFRPDSDDYSLGDTIAGIDPFGPDDPDNHVNDPASSARAKLLKAHERRNRILASHILGHILDENLKSIRL